jgi:uncharacterized protein (TIGR00369 family)
VHGGVIMRLMDEAGASAAMRHAGREAVTVAVDQVLFLEPVHLGDLVTFTAELTYVGRTSIEVRIDVIAPVAPLQLETESEREQWAAAQERQAYRLAQRDKRRSKA